MIENFSAEGISQILTTIGEGSENAAKAVGLAKQMRSLIPGKKDDPNTAELRAAIVELSEKLIEAETKSLTVRRQLLDLQTAVFEAQKKSNDFARYELWKAPAGGVVYRLMPEMMGMRPQHYLCPNCLARGEKSYLQGEYSAHCKPCDIYYEIKESDEPSVLTSYGSPFDD
jgi:hypothetical protein